MAELRDVIAYISQKYPHEDELSSARLAKMVYLADWKSAIDRSRQLTPINWMYNHYGPYVHDVLTTAENDDAFEVVRTRNIYGRLKRLIRANGKPTYPSLTDEDKRILDEIISITAPLSWRNFVEFVYSTYPVVSQPRYAELDLPQLAQEYKGSPVYAD